MQGSVRIIGLGESVPPEDELVTNEQVLEVLRQKGFDTKGKTGEDTEKLVGIRTRWWSKINSTKHAFEAAEAAIKDAIDRTNGRFNPSELGLIHSGGSSFDRGFPACACDLHGLLGIPTGKCEARDNHNACSSFVDALLITKSRMCDKGIRYGLVTVGETIGTRLNSPTSFNYCLWGDGGGAVVIEYDPDGDPNFGIIGDKQITDGQFAHWTKSLKLGCHPDAAKEEFYDASMEGHEKDIHRYACREVPKMINALLDECGIGVEEYPYLVPHPGNLIMDFEIGKRIGLREDRVLTCIVERGNPSSAGVPIALNYYAKQGLFKLGDLLILVQFGGGMVVAIILYKWG